jgi:hypothetical protein
LNRGEVNEDVIALLARDEAEAFLRVEELDSALSQRTIPFTREAHPIDITSTLQG